MKGTVVLEHIVDQENMADSFTFFIFWAVEKYGAYVLVMTALNQITLIWEGS